VFGGDTVLTLRPIRTTFTATQGAIMIYVGLFSIHPHLNQEQRMAGFARRAEWKYPAAVKLLGEYWRSTAPEVVTIFEASSYDQILEISAYWGDFFQMSIAPATTPEAGLAAAAKLKK
jgi:hypothetical protein